MDHLRELQRRVLIIAMTFLLVSVAAFPFFDQIVQVLTRPLGDKTDLVYLTPGGAITFMIEVCAYIGVIGALPVIIYQVYQFISPITKKLTLRHLIKYAVASFALALAGVLFAYFVSLPSAIYFLTSLDLSNINPMLTVDSYLTFVMTYLLAGAVLFQLPLVIMFINTIKPLTPKKLMHYQPHLIFWSFVVAAVISPTPDALNQALLASPVVVMYQLSTLMIWVHARRATKHQRAEQAPAHRAPIRTLQTPQLIAPVPSLSVAIPQMQPIVAAQSATTRRVNKSIDGFMRAPKRPTSTHVPSVRTVPPASAPLHAKTRYIDGFRPHAAQNIVFSARAV